MNLRSRRRVSWLCGLMVIVAPAVGAADSIPGATTGLIWSASGSSVALRWDAPSTGGAPTTYILEVGSSPGLADLANFTTGTTATTFATTGVASRAYFVRVRASNTAGIGAPSNEVTVIVGACGAPAAPVGLSIAASANHRLALTWSEPAGSPTSYVLEAGSRSGAADLSSSELRSTDPAYTASGVAGGTYFIRVRGRNACGTGDPSNEVVANMGVAPVYVSAARFGTACPSQGALGNSAGILICDQGKWRYAVSDEAPRALHGGYLAKPDWYPPLTGIFPSKMSCPAGGVHFTSAPLPVDQLTPFEPYGVVVGDHVTPIDHAYLAIRSLDKPVASRTEADYVPITAPAPGVIVELSSLGSPTSNRVVIDHGCGVYTVMMVINRPSGVLAPYADGVTHGQRYDLSLAVDAGVEIGRQRDNPLDFNVFDQSAWLTGLVNVFSYASEASKPYTASPTPYFTPSLGALFESLSRRPLAPRWGKIDYDVAGTAGGNWFMDGTVGYSCWLEADVVRATAEIPGGPIAGKNGGSYCHLALIPYWNQPGQLIASIGSWIDPNGDFVQFGIRLRSGQPAPEQLTAASGTTVYQLESMDRDWAPTGQVRGMIAVRVNADESLTVEMLPGATSPSAFTGFTARQRTYHR